MPAVFVSAILTAVGTTQLSNLKGGKSAESVGEESRLEFVALRQDIKNHCEQQVRDWSEQNVRDRDQDANLLMQTGGITDLQRVEATILERTKIIQDQLAQMSARIDKALSAHQPP